MVCNIHGKLKAKDIWLQKFTQDGREYSYNKCRLCKREFHIRWLKKKLKADNSSCEE